MKKTLAFFLSFFILVSCFAFPASADDSDSEDFWNAFLQVIPSPSDNPHIKVMKRSGNYAYLYFIYPQNFPENANMNYITEDNIYETENAYDYVTDYYAYNINDGELSGSGHQTTANTNSVSLSRITGINPLAPDSGGIQFIKINVLVDGNLIYNPNNCPDVFTYSIDRSNFTLQNNVSMNVNITFTQNYLNFITELRKTYSYVSSNYNFCIYISSVCPTNTETLLQSMNNSRYVKMQYGEYLYEGGVGYAELKDNPNTPDDASSLSEIPTSHSGKSAWTTAYGAHICTTLGVDSGTLTYPIRIDLENIEGFDSHTPIYVCVLGAYCGNKNDPQAFNEVNMSNALSGHSTPNDTYIEYFDTHTEVENPTPDYTFHTYYFPFECAANCVGDGYQGNCVYKPQIVDGKPYPNKKKISDYTNKGTKPDRLHDVDMDDSQWVKPEDYKKWQQDKYNSSKYTNEFNYDVVGLKDVLDQEGDFFKFISSAFNVFPSYILNIFVGFLIAMLAIVLLKFIL